MKRQLARALRRWADRIDRPAPPGSAPPLQPDPGLIVRSRRGKP